MTVIYYLITRTISLCDYFEFKEFIKSTSLKLEGLSSFFKIKTSPWLRPSYLFFTQMHSDIIDWEKTFEEHCNPDIDDILRSRILSPAQFTWPELEAQIDERANRYYEHFINSIEFARQQLDSDLLSTIKDLCESKQTLERLNAVVSDRINDNQKYLPQPQVKQILNYDVVQHAMHNRRASMFFSTPKNPRPRMIVIHHGRLHPKNHKMKQKHPT